MSARTVRNRDSTPDGFPLPTPRMVRCLGFGAEHHWLSPDPTHRRLCPKCTQKAAYLEYGMAEYRATESGEE